MKSFLLMLGLSVFTLCELNAQKGLKATSKVKTIEFKQTVNSQGVKFPPKLVISDLHFTELNGNQALDANENGFINFKITNNGKGEASNLKADVLNTGQKVPGIEIQKTTRIGTLYPGQSTEVYIPVNGTKDLVNGNAVLRIDINEANGFNPEPIVYTIQTNKFLAPKVVVADAQFATDEGDPIRVNYPVYLNLLIQDIGEGQAENVVAEIEIPDKTCMPLAKTLYNLGKLAAGESKEINFAFVPTRDFTKDTIPIMVKLAESQGMYAQNRLLSVAMGSELAVVNRSIGTKERNDSSKITLASLTAEVDRNIPISNFIDSNRIALIIGNEDYQSRQSGSDAEMNVDYARNDARIFKEYAKDVLGVDEENIFYLTDATAAEMKENIDLVSKIAAKIGPASEIIFYYAGHGLPEEATREPFLIPVDVSGYNLTGAIALKDVYAKFGNSGAGKVTIFLDACFSGGGRNSGLLAARSVRVKPKQDLLPGNIVVYAASSNDQVALPYKEKQHGMFTYFLLKELQETKGEVTYSQLSDYLEKNVSIESLRVNHKEQEPKVSVSNNASQTWGEWKIK